MAYASAAWTGYAALGAAFVLGLALGVWLCRPRAQGRRREALTLERRQMLAKSGDL